MNVCHFEYEHDMKLVGELLVSAPFMGLSICLPLYFLIFTSSWNCIKAWVYQYVFLFVFPYIWVYQCLFSLCIFLFSSRLLNCIKDEMEIIVVYKLGKDVVDFIDSMD